MHTFFPRLAHWMLYASILFCWTTTSALAQPSSQPAHRTSKATSQPAKRLQAPTSRPSTTHTHTSKPSATRSAAPIKWTKRAKRMRKSIQFIRKLLSAFLYKHGRDPKNPWLLSHSLLAFGKNLKLADGTSAVDHIVQNYLKFRKVGGKDAPYFPPGTQRNRIEPHPYMHLKTFLSIGVSLDRSFKVGKRTVTIRQMLDAAIRTFPSRAQGKAFGPLAWRMYLMYGRLPKEGWHWKRYDGQHVDFFRTLFRSFKYANTQSNFLRILQRRGVEIIPKQKQHIYKEACGGFHLLQSALRWMGHPQLRRHTQSALKEHINIIFYRMDGEVKLYLSMFKKYQKNPAYRFIVLLQQLKFLGHALETLTHLHEWGLFTPTPKQRKIIHSKLRLLLITVVLIKRLGFFKGINILKQKAYQFYLDLLGDSAHALHALTAIEKSPLYQ